MAHEPIDQLMNHARVKGSSRIIPDGMQPEAVTDEMAQQVVQSVLDYIGEARLSRSAVARSLGVSPTVIGLVLGLNYKGNQNQILIDLDNWLEQQIRRDAAPKISSFVFTRVAEEIHTVAEVACTLKTIGVVYSPESSGYGKTLALEAIAASKPGAVLVTMEKVSATASGLIAAIAHALKVSPANTRYAWNAIKNRLAGTDRLLMIDQAHALCGAPGDKPLYVLADLFDGTGSPQLWSGTSNICAYLQRGESRGKEPLAQIRRRIGIVRDLAERTRPGDGGPGEPLYSLEEIRQVFARGKMRLTPDAVRYVWQLACTPGSGALGMATNLVRMATAINQATGDTLTAEMLRDAHRMLVSRSSFAAAEECMNEPAVRRARSA